MDNADLARSPSKFPETETRTKWEPGVRQRCNRSRFGAQSVEVAVFFGVSVFLRIRTQVSTKVRIRAVPRTGSTLEYADVSLLITLEYADLCNPAEQNRARPVWPECADSGLPGLGGWFRPDSCSCLPVALFPGAPYG